MSEKQTHKVVANLHDARISERRQSGDTLQVVVKSWDESEKVIRFHEPFLTRSIVGDGDLEELRECGGSLLLGETKAHLERLGWADEHLQKLRHFKFVDVSEYAILEVVCTSLVLPDA